MIHTESPTLTTLLMCDAEHTAYLKTMEWPVK